MDVSRFSVDTIIRFLFWSIRTGLVVLKAKHGDVVAMRIECVHLSQPAVRVRRHVDVILDEQRRLAIGWRRLPRVIIIITKTA